MSWKLGSGGRLRLTSQFDVTGDQQNPGTAGYPSFLCMGENLPAARECRLVRYSSTTREIFTSLPGIGLPCTLTAA